MLSFHAFVGMASEKILEQIAQRRVWIPSHHCHNFKNSPGGGLDNMIAYVDKFGNITSEPPAEEDAIKPEEAEKASGS